MKKSFNWLILLLGCTKLFAQSFDSPESVEWDAAYNRWLIANPGSGEVQQQLPGQSPSLFATGCTSGPYGIEILGDVLYANDGGRIRGFHLSNGAEVFNLNLQGSFLNGLTTDGDSVLYATDFGADKVFRINPSANTYYTLQSGLSETPNGIVYDAENERCVIVCWGSNAPLLSMSVLPPYTIATVMNTSLGNCDGISRDQTGYYYVTAWSNSRLNRIAPDFSGSPVALAQQLFSPADIDIKWDDVDTAGIPNASANTVVYVPLSATAGAEEVVYQELTLRAFPDGEHTGVWVEAILKETTPVVLSLYTLSGQVVGSRQFVPEIKGKNLFKLPVTNLVAGVYLIRMEAEGRVLETKVFVI